MSDKLLPCPFCGGEAEIKTIGNDVLLSTHRLTANSRIKCGTIIKCTTFGCQIEKRVFTLRGPISQTRDWAITAWNTRSESVNQKLLDALKDIRIRFVGLFDSYVRKTYVGSDGQSDLNLALYDTDKAISEAEREKLK